MSPAHLLLYANLVSVLLLDFILLCRRELGLALPKSRQELLRSASLGLLNPFLYYLILFKAFALLPAQEAQPLNYTWAIPLSILAVPLFKQKLCLCESLAITLVLIHFLVGEEILPSTFYGLVLIVVGLVLQQVFRNVEPS